MSAPTIPDIPHLLEASQATIVADGARLSADEALQAAEFFGA